jgi:formate transporter FocA
MEEHPGLSFDALMPREMAAKAEAAGVAKARLGPYRMLALAMLAGAFIALGAVFSTTVTAGGQAVPYGLLRVAAGLAFSLGLILVVVAGAELFTGNNLIVMAWASGDVTTAQMLRNWIIVYLGNFIGAVVTAAMMYFCEQYRLAGGVVGLAALNLAQAKASLDFFPALVLGVLCNVLVCLAVWLCMSARSTTDKILSIVMPIAAFVAAGFEHSVANMYFIPVALFIKAGAPQSFWAAIGKTAADFPALTWGRFLVGNLLPVTLGNIIGGAGLVGLVYWFIYLRPSWVRPPAGGNT